MNTQTNTANSTGAGTASGVAGFVGGLGLGVIDGSDGSGVGPFVVSEIVDSGGGVVGVVGVIDDASVVGGGPDGLLDGAARAAGSELGGAVRAGGPVATAAELRARFSVPVETVAYGTDGTPRVVVITATDRRNNNNSGSSSQSSPAGGSGPGLVGGLEKLVNVSLEVSVELGRTRVTLADVLAFDVGSNIELDRAAGAPVDIRVNDTLLAQGEVVLIDDEYAVRITAIIDPTQQPN